MPVNEFDYNNLSHRPPGRFIRLGAKLHPGIRSVQGHIVPYAESWKQANAKALHTTGPFMVVLGDSMAQGIGASRYDLSWAGQLHRMLEQTGQHYQLVNLSVSGARVMDVLDRQLPALEQLNSNPALVLVLIGSNDMVSKKYRNALPSNYEALLSRLPKGSIVASPFGNTGLGAVMNRLIVTQARRHQLRVVDNNLGTNLSSWRGKLAADHFHPNEHGYRELAEGFYHTLTADWPDTDTPTLLP